MIGLCKRAGRLSSGEFAVSKSVKEGSAKLIIVAEDASENTKKKFTNMCEFYKIELLEAGKLSLLGRALGKEKRAVICIADEGFCKSLKKALDD